MGSIGRKKTYKRIALILSLLGILLWSALGTGASLAWFADTSEEIKNIFHFGKFDLEVSYRLPDGSWKPMDGQTGIFDDNALYEPGYVQVVYLKIENKGSVPFDFKAAVSVTDYTEATNYFGQRFSLQDHLQFGLVIADSPEEIDAKTADREQVKQFANTPLNNYATDAAALDAGDTVYMALAVTMPQVVGNEANYRGSTIPRVELGIIVEATQQ